MDIDVISLNPKSISDGQNWFSENIARFNNNSVRLRAMESCEAPWHSHEETDELFLVIDGSIVMDTEQESVIVGKNQLFVIPRGIKHRSRVEGKATLLVIDSIDN